MREKMLAEWKQKNDMLEYEIYQIEKKLEYARKRQENLKHDIITFIFFLAVDIFVFSFLFLMEGSIMVGFDKVYFLVVRAGAVSSVLFLVFRILQAVRRNIYHHSSIGQWEEPKMRRSVSDVGLPPEKNYQIEIEKLCWVQKRYQMSRQKMDDMYRKLQEDREEMDQEEWQAFLDSIIIYETIKPARL